MRKNFIILFIAAMAALTLNSCGESDNHSEVVKATTINQTKAIEPVAKTGDLLIDHFNLADRLIGETYGNALQLLKAEGWVLHNKDYRFFVYEYIHPSDSLQITMQIDFGTYYEAVYVCITFIDPNAWDEDLATDIYDVDRAKTLMQRIGKSYELHSGPVCYSYGFHAYDGAFNHDGDDFESVLKQLSDHWPSRYYEASWMSSDENSFISIGCSINAVHNYLGISISSNSINVTPCSFRWF